MDSTVPRTFPNDEETTPDFIEVMIPYGIYRRVYTALTFMGSSTKPEDYIVAVLEGHVRKLNLGTGEAGTAGIAGAVKRTVHAEGRVSSASAGFLTRCTKECNDGENHIIMAYRCGRRNRQTEQV